MIWPHGSVVLGSRLARFTAAGLKSAGLIWLFTYGARKATCRPPLHAGDVNAVKSPASIAGVGTHAMFDGGLLRIGVRLIRAEEEEPVPQDRTAQRAPELVPLEAVVIPLRHRDQSTQTGSSR